MTTKITAKKSGRGYKFVATPEARPGKRYIPTRSITTFPTKAEALRVGREIYRQTPST